MDVDVYLLSIC